MSQDLVAVIPAFNCGPQIAEVVRGLEGSVSRVIVVDDGSEDDTASRARLAGAEVDGLQPNRGKGVALRHGIELALAGDPAALLLLDGDGQHDPADAPKLIAEWKKGGADLVIGTRMDEAQSIPSARYWTNYVGTRALSWMTGLELSDSQSGYRLLDAGLIRRLPLSARGYAIETEILIKAVKQGARISYAPIRAIYEGAVSHFRPLRDTLGICFLAIYYKVYDDA